MNVFETCLPKRTGTRIYLPEDEEGEERTSCFSCCLWTRNKYQEGLIRLPEGRRTIDDYLDPRSPVSIEVLLAEQEEELDHYLGQTDDEDAFINSRRKYSFVNNTFLEEDAQFLSEHRISAILVDRPKVKSVVIQFFFIHIFFSLVVQIYFNPKILRVHQIINKNFWKL